MENGDDVDDVFDGLETELVEYGDGVDDNEDVDDDGWSLSLLDEYGAA